MKNDNDNDANDFRNSIVQLFNSLILGFWLFIVSKTEDYCFEILIV